MLGEYKIKKFDTDVASYGVSKITDNQLTLPPRTAPPLRRR